MYNLKEFYYSVKTIVNQQRAARALLRSGPAQADLNCAMFGSASGLGTSLEWHGCGYADARALGPSQAGDPGTCSSRTPASAAQPRTVFGHRATRGAAALRRDPGVPLGDP